DALIDEFDKRARDDGREPEARIALALAAAYAASDFMGDPDKALRVLVPLLDAELADLPTCERIEELALRKADVALVERALEAGSRLAAGTDAQLPMLVRLGEARIELAQGDAGKWGEAVEAFRDALDIDIGLAPAIRGLELVLE